MCAEIADQTGKIFALRGMGMPIGVSLKPSKLRVWRIENE